MRQAIKPNCLQLALALIDQTSAANVANNNDNNNSNIISISCCTSHRTGSEEKEGAVSQLKPKLVPLLLPHWPDVCTLSWMMRFSCDWPTCNPFSQRHSPRPMPETISVCWCAPWFILCSLLLNKNLRYYVWVSVGVRFYCAKLFKDLLQISKHMLTYTHSHIHMCIVRQPWVAFISRVCGLIIWHHSAHAAYTQS